MAPRLSKWPFLLSDGLLLGLAFLIYAQGKLPLGHWELLACTVCVAVGAAAGVLPFILEYRVLGRLLEAERLATVVDQIQKINRVAAQISEATGRWQSVQEAADRSAGVAREIAERIATEVRNFNEFLQHANEGEKCALRLEVEKLRRAEADWLQVLVRTLDHVYALNQAALRSRQPSLIEQLGQFQNACRDAARRVGLTPFAAAPDEPFDAQVHRLADGDGSGSAGAAIEETTATGYTFQGRLLRPALVRLRNGAGEEPPPAPSPAADAGPAAGQTQLPLPAAETDSTV